MTSVTYSYGQNSRIMTSEEREALIAENFLKTFEEKSPLDYDILDSMFQDMKQVPQPIRD